MPLTIGVVKETASHEARVALTPDVAAKLIELGASVHLERVRVCAAIYPTQLYKGATLHSSAAEVLAAAQVLLKVQPPTLEEVAQLSPGALVDWIHAGARPDGARAGA